MNPFDYVQAINQTKKDLMSGTENDALAEKSYNPYITNKSLSHFPDTILYANEMNLNPILDNKLQFYYLINIVRPKKRFSKWVKKTEDDDVEAVMKYYGYNIKRAEEVMRILSKKQIIEIKKKIKLE